MSGLAVVIIVVGIAIFSAWVWAATSIIAHVLNSIEKGQKKMYTVGIRKIFVCNNILKNMSLVKTLAESAGYNALSFNGDIYVRIEEDDYNGWVHTCFQITDFQDVQA